MSSRQKSDIGGLEIRLTGRWPSRLPHSTARYVSNLPIPQWSQPHLEAPEGGLTSIVAVTFNAFVFTKLCLLSLLGNTACSSCEVILVDNASTDGTEVLVREVASRNPRVHLVSNSENLGFPTAVNMGLRKAKGNWLVILNSDTLVPPGWLETLLGPLANESVGLVGPTTNRCGTEAEIGCHYRTYSEFLGFAAERRRKWAGRATEVEMLSMFCLAVTREVFRTIGPLDEMFQTGLFEDDDYSMRARQAGYRLVLAEDCFVHHYGQTSFGQVGQDGYHYGELFLENRRRFEKKWQRAWSPRCRRTAPEYEELRAELARILKSVLPSAARVLVVSRGDPALVELLGSRFGHFPQNCVGEWAGFYPADSAACIEHLEELRMRGAQYLVFPRTALWWLDHYWEFETHLRKHSEKVFDEAEKAVVFRLGEA